MNHKSSRLDTHPLIPNPEELNDILSLDFSSQTYDLLGDSLFTPLNDVLSSEGKKFRTEMIEIGFHFAGGKMNESILEQLHVGSQMIEGLHAGSMIIDDIQDQSTIRRGKMALHCKYGVGIALNAGNWLYFRALEELSKLKLKPEQELNLYRYMNKILLRAHFGQAIDVGVPMTSLPQARVMATCLAAMELKTGALMSLAFNLGAFLAADGKFPSPSGTLFSKRFGVALQMFDDIGNFLIPPPRQKEDLQKGRPSFIWGMAAQMSRPEEYERFLDAIRRLPDESLIIPWSERFDLVSESKKAASQYLWNTFQTLEFSDEPTEARLHLEGQLDQLFKKLESSYV